MSPVQSRVQPAPTRLGPACLGLPCTCLLNRCLHHEVVRAAQASPTTEGKQEDRQETGVLVCCEEARLGCQSWEGRTMPCTVAPSQTKSYQRRQRRHEGSVTPLGAPLTSLGSESPPLTPGKQREWGTPEYLPESSGNKEGHRWRHPKFLSSPFSGCDSAPPLPVLTPGQPS